MAATDILTTAEADEWLRVDGDDVTIGVLIQAAYDAADGCIDGFADKLKSTKFKRKLKLFMLNYIVSAYDKRGLEDESAGAIEKRRIADGAGNKMDFVNATLLMQLQYGTYLETDT